MGFLHGKQAERLAAYAASTFLFGGSPTGAGPAQDRRRWENLYYEKGGTETFNCRPVLLTPEDLDRLEADIRSTALPETTGFFFGKTDGSERDEDLAFIAKARAAMAEGFTVYYDSWW